MIGYPSRQDGAILPAWDFSLGPARSKIIFFGVLSHIINPLLTKLVRSRWLDIGLVLFFLRVYGPRRRHKKELGQYSAILTSHLVNNPYTRLWFNKNKKNNKIKGATVGHTILGNFSTDRMVIELTKISK